MKLHTWCQWHRWNTVQSNHITWDAETWTINTCSFIWTHQLYGVSETTQNHGETALILLMNVLFYIELYQGVCFNAIKVSCLTCFLFQHDPARSSSSPHVFFFVFSWGCCLAAEALWSTVLYWRHSKTQRSLRPQEGVSAEWNSAMQVWTWCTWTCWKVLQ